MDARNSEQVVEPDNRQAKRSGKWVLGLAWTLVLGVLATLYMRQQHDRKPKVDGAQQARQQLIERVQQEAGILNLLRPIREAAGLGNLPAFKRGIADAFPKGPSEEAAVVLDDAVRDGRLDIIKFWFSQPWPKQYKGRPLIQHLIERSGYYHNTKTVRYLLSLVPSGVPSSPDGACLFIACKGYTDADAEVAKIFIEAGVPVNFVGRQMSTEGAAPDQQAGRTAIMYAAQRGRIDVVKALLKHHAAVNRVSDRGETALQLAQKSGHPEIVALLEEAAKSSPP